MEVKLKIEYELSLFIHTGHEDWKEATQEQKELYIKEEFADHIVDRIDYIIDDLLENATLTYIKTEDDEYSS